MRSGERARLLVVEDQHALARAMSRALTARGFTVVTALTCAEARAAHGAFDAGIFDVDLPDGDGIELAEDLLRAGAVATVAFFSGQSEPETLERARLLGPFVSKADGVAAVVDLVPEILATALRAIAAGGEETDARGPMRNRSGLRRKVPR